jgi:hypothetical protein
MRRVTLPILCLATLVSACTLPLGGTSPEPPDSPATPTLIGVSLPPAWTATPADASPATARPSLPSTDIATETPAPVVSTLRLGELPAGYIPAQPIALGLSPAALSAGVLPTPAIALFEEPTTGVLVFSAASVLASPAEEQAVALGIETPTTLVEVLAGALGQLEGSARILNGFGDIGTASAAAEGRIVYREFRYDLQLVLMRQGAIAAYIAVMTPLGLRPGFDLKELAQAYAARVRVSNITDAPTVPAP